MVGNALQITQAVDGLDDDAIERLAGVLETAEVVPALHGIVELRRRLYQMEKMLKSRIVAESILSGGESWTAPDGTEFAWVGDRERVCSDPAAMRSQLEKLPFTAIAKRALQATFKDQPMKIYLTQLDQVEKFGGPEAGRIIRSFVSWKEGAPKLRNLSEDGR